MNDAAHEAARVHGHRRQLAQRCRYYCGTGVSPSTTGRHGPYDLVVDLLDVFLQKNIAATDRSRSGAITDPEDDNFRLVAAPLAHSRSGPRDGPRRLPRLCVASDRSRSVRRQGQGGGDRGHRRSTSTTATLSRQHFPHRDFVLVYTSIAAGSPPWRRSKSRSSSMRSGARDDLQVPPQRRPRASGGGSESVCTGCPIFTTGSAEAMIANCDVLITRYSSTVFVGLALGKETHSDYPMDELRRLQPVQNRSAALNIAMCAAGCSKIGRCNDRRKRRKFPHERGRHGPGDDVVAGPAAFSAIAVGGLRGQSELGPADPLAGASAAGLGASPVFRQRRDGHAAGRAAWQGRRARRRLHQSHSQPEVLRKAGILRILRMCRRRRGGSKAFRSRARVAHPTRHDGVARAGESVAQLHLRPARRRLRSPPDVSRRRTTRVLCRPHRRVRIRQSAGPLRLRDGCGAPREAGRALQACGDVLARGR